MFSVQCSVTVPWHDRQALSQVSPTPHDRRRAPILAGRAESLCVTELAGAERTGPVHTGYPARPCLRAVAPQPGGPPGQRCDGVGSIPRPARGGGDRVPPSCDAGAALHAYGAWAYVLSRVGGPTGSRVIEWPWEESRRGARGRGRYLRRVERRPPPSVTVAPI